MRSKIQDAWLSALETILRPIVRLWLQSGLGYSEFATVAKSVFVQVATEDNKRRGRPANFSQVSAMTGISRKEVSRIRNAESPIRWTPDMETSPLNTILHHWHFDEAFSDGAGRARPIPLEGPGSFAELVSRYGGDLPPGAMRVALQNAGVVDTTPEGGLLPRQSFYYSRRFDEDFIRGLAFSLSSLGSTLAHNASVFLQSDLPHAGRRDLARLERTAWSEHLSKDDARYVKQWVTETAPRFLADAQRVIGERELPRSAWADAAPRVVGVGVFFFEED